MKLAQAQAQAQVPAPAPRPYDLGKRALTVARTRRRILTAARRLLLEGDTRVSLEVVALKAGVGRPTIYRHFGSRAALVRALIAEVAESANLRPNLEAALASAEPRAAVTACVIASARTWESDTNLVRALVRISADPEFASVIEEIEMSRFRDALVVASKTGGSPAQTKRIAAGLMTLTHPHAYLYLVDVMHVSPAAARSLLVRISIGLIDGGDADGE